MIEKNIKGWVLYDGMCGFCSWWIPFWKKQINKTGYDIAMLQDKWIREKLKISDDEVNRDIVLLFKNGETLIGADAYIFGMKTVWWSSPAGFLLSLPGLKQLTWMFYKLFNKNRFLVSKLCRLKPVLQ